MGDFENNNGAIYFLICSFNANTSIVPQNAIVNPPWGRIYSVIACISVSPESNITGLPFDAK